MGLNQKVCIVGAGPSGIAATKTLVEKGLDVVCFEKGSGLGGIWRYNNDNGMSSCYSSLHINTDKIISAYPDFPMPEGFPDYPRHDQMLVYFENYVDHFNIRKNLRFNSEVTKVEKNPNGGWDVTIKNGSTEHFTSVIVANGHHWDPYIPDFPGEFTGEKIHSHYYRTLDGFKDKRVLIIGIGNSSADIACDLWRTAKKVMISTRSGAYVVPKHIFGIPTTQIQSFFKFILFYVPLSALNFGFKTLIWLAQGSAHKKSFPAPNHKLFHAHPTTSAELLTRVAHGDVIIKQNIKKMHGTKVSFTDDTEEEIDTIIYATGYNVNFPFLDPKIMKATDNEVSLYHNVVHPEHKDLYFVGFIQPIGVIFPLSHIQGQWIAKILTGEVILPNKEVMVKAIETHNNKRRKHYKKSIRHGIEVEFYQYIHLIQKEMKKFQRKQV